MEQYEVGDAVVIKTDIEAEVKDGGDITDEYRMIMSKIEKISEGYARKRRKNEELERQRKKLKMMKFIQNDYENLDDTDLVYCLKRMAEY